MLTLYNYYRSSASFRVRIALNLKNLDFKEIPIHLVNNGGEQHSPEYRAINPQGLVPTLIDDQKIITQSLAIIEYLEDVHPTPALLPKDAFTKSFARSIAMIIAADIHPLNNSGVLKYLTNTFKISEEQKNEWYHHWIARGLAALEKKISTSNLSGDFCIGNTPSLADIFIVPQMYNAKRFECDTSPYPTLMRINEHCQQHPAFKKAWPQEPV